MKLATAEDSTRIERQPYSEFMPHGSVYAALAAAAGRHAMRPALSRIERTLADSEASALLRAEVDAAIACGVFGSPFVIVDGAPFFGVDKLELLDEWLARGGW